MSALLAGARRRLLSPAGAAVFAAVFVALVAAGVPLGALSHSLDWSNIEWFAVVAAFGAVGFVVAWRQPQNALGWLLLATAVVMFVQTDANYYVTWDYVFRHGGLPWGPVAVYLSINPPIALLLSLAILLFPDGRLPSPRWKWLLAPVAVVAALTFLGAVGALTQLLVDHQRFVVSASTGNIALGHAGRDWSWATQAQKFNAVVLAVLLVVWLAHHVPRYRRSSGDYRLQMKWLVAGALTTAVFGSLLTYLSSSVNPSTPWWLLGLMALSELGLAGLPICMGVAILRYRLYEIDRLVSRTLSYAIVTATLVGVYVGVVTLGTHLLPHSSPVAVAASTLVAAALFNPLRHRVQRAVDRRFNRPRYNAEATVAAFAARLRDEVDLGAVSDELVGAVTKAVEPVHVSVWIR
jgi:hypothetical protein